MGFGLRASKGLVGFKKETSAYTAEALAGADAFAAFDINVSINGNDYQRKELKNHWGKELPITGMGETEISFKTIGRDKGADAVAIPWFDPLLRCCGLRRDLNTTVSQTYKPTSVNYGTADASPIFHPYLAGTVGVWLDGLHIKAGGCQGNVVMTFKAGDPIEYAWTFKGAFVMPTDIAMPTPSLITLTNYVTSQFVSATLTANSVAMPTETVTFDLGNVLSKLIDANNAAGMKGSIITDRNPTIKMNPELATKATYDYFGDARDSVSRAFNLGPVPTTGAGKITQLTAAQFAIKMPSLGEREGMRTAEIEAALAGTGGTEMVEFTLLYQ